MRVAISEPLRCLLIFNLEVNKYKPAQHKLRLSFFSGPTIFPLLIICRNRLIDTSGLLYFNTAQIIKDHLNLPSLPASHWLAEQGNNSDWGFSFHRGSSWSHRKLCWESSLYVGMIEKKSFVLSTPVITVLCLHLYPEEHVIVCKHDNPILI